MSTRLLSDEWSSVTTTLLAIGTQTAYAGQLAEAIRILDQAITLLDTASASDRDRARMLIGYGQLLSLDNFQGNGDFDATLAILERSRELATAIDDRALFGDVLDLIGMTRYYRALARRDGEFGEALPGFEQALAIRDELGDQRGVAESIFHIGLIEQNTNRWDAARTTFERATSIAQEGNHHLEHSYAVRHLGFVLQRDGDLPGARRCLETSLELRQAIGFRIFLPFSHLALGDVCLQQGDLDAARTHFETALVIAREIASPSQTIFALISLGEVASAAGQPDAAGGYLRQAHDAASAANFERGVALAERLLADLDSSLA